MTPFTKHVSRFARWAFGQSDSQLPPWIVDSIQRGALDYSYKNIPMLKDPFDLALYGLLIGRLRPRTIIEIGTYKGGTATWLADQLLIHGIDGTVHSIDVIPVDLPPTPRVMLYQGSARDIEKLFPPAWLEAQPRPLLVIDDGDHSYTSVLHVLEYFSAHMRSGEYLAIEDSASGDLGLARKFDGGPLRAIRAFMARNATLEIDRSYCDFYGRNMTWNVDGYLRRV